MQNKLNGSSFGHLLHSKHLYLNGVWLSVDLRTNNIKIDPCFEIPDYIRLQGVVTSTLHSIVNTIDEEGREPICSFKNQHTSCTSYIHN